MAGDNQQYGHQSPTPRPSVRARAAKGRATQSGSGQVSQTQASTQAAAQQQQRQRMQQQAVAQQQQGQRVQQPSSQQPQRQRVPQQRQQVRQNPQQAATQQARQQDPRLRQHYQRQQYQQYRQNAQHQARDQYAGMRPANAHQYTRAATRAGRKQRGRNPAPRIIAGILALVIVAAVVIFIFFPPFYNVTINGESYRVDAGFTVQKAIDSGYADPDPGDLLAVDGSVAKKGGGDVFAAELNGEATNDPNAVIPRDGTCDISDGADVTESYQSTTETIAHGEREIPASSSAYFTAAIHVYSEGEDGEQVVKTGDVSGITVTEVTKQPVDAGYTGYSVDTGGQKVVALTFDDGPWPTTSEGVLDVLEQYGAHATFFEIGQQVEEYGDISKKLYEAGNQLASHTYDHAAGTGKGVNLTYMSSDAQVEEVQKGFAALDSVTGTTVHRVLRCPGGNYYGSLISTIAPYVDYEIGWDVDTEDWRKPGADSIAEMIESAEPGEVVLMHDGGGDRTQTVEALKTALPYLQEQGYTFVTIDELLNNYTLVAK